MIRTGLTASAAAIAIMLGAWIWLAVAMPESATQVPIDWGASGAPERFVSRAEALGFFGLLPAIGLALALLLAAVPRIEPLRANLMKGERAYLIAWIGLEAMLALVTLGLSFASTAPADGSAASDAFFNRVFAKVVLAATGVLFVFLGDALPKTRPNFSLGIRTPWTLSSDLSWEKTHRFAGRLMVLTGLWQIIAPFLLSGVPLIVAFAAPLLAFALAAFIYSYAVWRGDPNRRRSIQEA
jgi:hypothetical protein